MTLCSLDNSIILIVDDNSNNLAVLSNALKSAGFKTRVAMDGEAAIEQVEENPPELILLDVQMPGIDGFETCLRLKANPKTQEIPIIFITASADVNHKVKGLSLGAVDYVTKPFQYEEVVARVKVHLELRFLTQKVQEQAIALQVVNQELRRLANLDGLTKVANRRRFDECLEQEWARLMREKSTLSLILCDIDYFKLYNDFYGHQAGDACLTQVAHVIASTIKRPADLVARYGGEEFAVILPGTSPEGACQVAEAIRLSVKELQIPHIRSEIDSRISISLGISSKVPNPALKPESLVTFADKALYQAKAKGRDQHFFHDEA